VNLKDKIKSRNAMIGIIGLGYVGLPIARAFTGRGFRVIGFDIDSEKVEKLVAGLSYIRHISAGVIAEMLSKGFEPTGDYERLPEADAILVCVPTPLGRHDEPDLTYVEQTARDRRAY